MTSKQWPPVNEVPLFVSWGWSLTTCFTVFIYCITNYNILHANLNTFLALQRDRQHLQHPCRAFLRWRYRRSGHLQHPGVNFTNILLTTFLLKSVLHSFSLMTVWLCNFFFKRIFAQKLLVKCWWNWLQYETSCETRYNTYEIEQDEPVCTMELEKKCKNVTGLSNTLLFPLRYLQN